MASIRRQLWKAALGGGIALIAGLASLYAAVPKGWRIAGSRPEAYEAGVERVRVTVPAEGNVAGNDLPSAYLRSRRPNVEGFGTLMQNFTLGAYAGQRIRFSAFVRAEAVQDWAGLWMRIDSGGFSKLANMQDRPIQGTTGWRRYGITLDVPQKAHHVAFGLVLAGSGAVWINRVEIEARDLKVPESSPQPVKGPVNLDFQGP